MHLVPRSKVIRTQGLSNPFMLESPSNFVPWAHMDAMTHYQHMNLVDMNP